MKTVAIHSQKGGVGKTSMTINLAHKAMEFGFETLVIDLDPQGSATFFLGQGQATKLKAKHWLSHEIDWNRYIEATPYDGVFILPARKGLRKLDRLMASDVSDKHIKRLLKSLKSQFDLVLIDCPPGINTVIEQAYRAADRVLVPLTPTPLCLESFRTLREFVDDVAIPSDTLAPFFNRVNLRLELHRASLKQFAQDAGKPQLGWVRATTLIEKMAIDKKAVTESHPAHRVSRDINALWKVLMRDLDLHH